MPTTFFDAARDLLQSIAVSQKNIIQETASLVASNLMDGGIWHLFGTGHSHVIAEEVYYRAGGLAPVNAILFPALMQHEGPVSGTKLERLPGLARIVFEQQDIRPGEVLTIISNNGTNAVPIEMALLARARGLKTIALTSLEQSKAAPYGKGQDKKLYELCDIVIDNGGGAGDAVLPVPGSTLHTASTSTLANIAIVQQLVYAICCRFQESGVEPPLFKTTNPPGSDEWNQAPIDRYGDR
ncbi:MAG: SIS domain-containing protein, partial [Candidatus Hydrogenedentes bacterium]|nr:SIS domain-containing protein [Candidatus Hydrogenedentota bacterium]